MTSAADVLGPYERWLRGDPTIIAAALEHYEALLIKWNVVHNLVSRETMSEFWKRHIADSLQLLPLIGEEEGRFADLGSGGGLPAIPLAIASSGRTRHFDLYEPVMKKVSFLRTVARECSLPITVWPERVGIGERRATANLITSRALTSLTNLLPLLHPFAAPSTRALLHKGREYRRELTEASQHHQFDVLVHQSSVDPEGVVLELTRFG
jgi:16S rRNA (guanine527-N7)-methyltransferase